MANFGLFPRSSLLQSLPTPCPWSFALVVFPFHLNRLRFLLSFAVRCHLSFICGFGRPFTFALRALYHLAPAPYQLASALYQLASAPLSIGSGPFTIWLRPFITNHLAALSAPFSFALWAPLSFGSGPFLFPGHRPPLLASALSHSAVALAEHSVGFPPSSPLASGTLTGPFPLAVTFSSRASQRFIFLSVCSIEFSSASPGAPFPRLSVSPGSNCRLHTCMTVPT